MDAKEVFAIWAPYDAVWSRWAKPVAFAQLGRRTTLPAPITLPTLQGLPRPTDQTAVVANLPGAEAIQVGLLLAQMGFRPVPLYNASEGTDAVVPMREIVDGLVAGTEILQRTYLDPAAPPVFLLDSNRLKGLTAPAPGMFDNRWIVFPQDMPSATFMRSQKIERVQLLLRGRVTVDDDLAHVFLRWKQAGIELLVRDPFGTQPPDELPVRRPSQFRMRYLALMFVMLGLRRSNVGGFGSFVPTPSRGGG